MFYSREDGQGDERPSSTEELLTKLTGLAPIDLRNLK